MKSTKSFSDSRLTKPRLSRTLKRKATWREATVNDIKYFWAAYKKFNKNRDFSNITPEDFRQETTIYLSQYDFVWILETSRPIGVVLAHHAGPMVMIENIVWFPWATKRDILTSMVHFINDKRNKQIILGYTTEEDKNFYVHLCKYGILRRVGSVHDIYKDSPACLFQTRET